MSHIPTVKPTDTPDRLTIDVARPTALTKDAGKLAMTAGLLSHITSVQQASDAAQFVRGLRERVRRIKAHYLDVRRPLNAALDEIRAMEKADLAPWEAADKQVSAPLLAWQVAEQQRAKEENARRLADAEARAAADRDQQAAAIRAAAASAPTKAAAKALERQAKDVERASLLPIATEPAVATKLPGVNLTTRRRATVVNFGALVRAVAAGKVPLDALVPNQPWLDARAVEQGKDLNLPGVVCSETSGLSARGA